MSEVKITCSMCDEPIEDGAQYYDIDSGDFCLCSECYDAMDVDEAVALFDVDVSDILDMHNVVKKTKEEEKPAPEPPIPGQIMVMDDGSLQELTAEAIA